MYRSSGPRGLLKKKRTEKYPEMELQVYQNILDRRNNGLEISNIDIQEMAREIVQRDFGDMDFKASNPWCNKFMKRFSLVRRATTHTSRKVTFSEADLAIHEQFFLEFEEHIHIRKTPHSRILNMDQTMIRVVAPGKTTVSPKGVKQVSKSGSYSIPNSPSFVFEFSEVPKMRNFLCLLSFR